MPSNRPVDRDISAANFRAGFPSGPASVVEFRKRIEGCALAGAAAGDHGVANLIQRGALALRKTHANRVGAIVDHHRRRRGLALQKPRWHPARFPAERIRSARRPQDRPSSRSPDPLMVFSMPSFTSTTPLIFLTLSPTFGAQFFSRAGSCENNLISMGSGAPVRSPIMSCSTCLNSTSSCGYCLLTFSRTSDITSSMLRLRSRFKRTEISPVLASVTAARPSCNPVRREVLSTSGVARRIFSTPNST